MNKFRSKDYQEQAIESVTRYFLKARSVGHVQAWAECAPVRKNGQVPIYDGQCLGDVPAVCIRIPTGGGKTTIAVHMAAKVGQVYGDTDTPVVLWVVPSDAIRSQTIASLQSDSDPCGAGMRERFGSQFVVCGLDGLGSISPHDVKSGAIVVVATIQSFNVKNTAQRTVYSFDEHMERHFQSLPHDIADRLERVTESDLAAQPYLTTADLGRIKASVANWFALHRPIVVVDEAHNNRTDQAFRTLRRLHPSCVLEMTATPVQGSNVLFHVSAQALAAEDMIKLPIVMAGQPVGWKETVRDAVLNRQRLEQLALHEADYVRPVMLLQAQPKGGEVTVDVLLAHLMDADGEKIPRSQIAIATGDQKELDGINLMDMHCQVRYVITVEALKEGWNCPFAYVLCSLQDMRSAKDIEQLLGRVLRMPYARRRTSHDDLNKAYAHVVSSNVRIEAQLLKDRMVSNMGFDAMEAEMALVPSQWTLETVDAVVPAFKPMKIESVVALPTAPTIQMPEHLRERILIQPAGSGGVVAVIKGDLSQDVEDFLLSACTPRHQARVLDAIQNERERLAASQSPAVRGEVFCSLPQMCLLLDGEVQPIDKQVLSELGAFDLLAEPVSLDQFEIHETGSVYEVVLKDEHLYTKFASTQQLALDSVSTHVTEHDLVRWLDRQCRHAGLMQASMLKWLSATVRYLLGKPPITLTALVRCKQALAVAIRAEIARREKLATRKGVQMSLPQWAASPRLEDRFRYEFRFEPNRYPGRPPFYRGSQLFEKHYYGSHMIHDLREKTAAGHEAEEFLCAVAIEEQPAVKFWVRNVESDARFSFWLPVQGGYFYPDFVCQLKDGRILVVEYKGDMLASNDESRHKEEVGDLWEKTSDGRCLFLMALRNKAGLGVAQQIDRKIKGIL